MLDKIIFALICWIFWLVCKSEVPWKAIEAVRNEKEWEFARSERMMAVIQFRMEFLHFARVTDFMHD